MQECRASIKASNLEKKGWNSYSEYAYYTPEQVDQLVNEVCTAHKILHKFQLKRNEFGLYGLLEIICLETGQTISFEAATEMPEIKATNASQQIQSYSRASFNTIKSNHPATTNLYMQEFINGIEKYDEIVRSLSLASGWGIGNKPITTATLNVGENNQTIYVYEDAQGGVTISNYQSHNLFNISQQNNTVDMELITTSFNYSSTTYIPVYNFSFNKSQSSYSIPDQNITR